MKEQVLTWLDALVGASQNAVTKVIWFMPNLVAALLVLLIGTIMGRYLGNFIERALVSIKLDRWTSKLDLKQYIEPFGLKSVPQFVGKLTHLFIFLIAVIAAADIANFSNITSLLQSVLLYIPKAIVALLILFVGLASAQLSEGFIKGNLVQKVPLLRGLVKFLIVTFALLAALDQLGVSSRLVQILFAGIIFAMSLGAGLAFGLGGRDYARDILSKLRQK